MKRLAMLLVLALVASSTGQANPQPYRCEPGAVVTGVPHPCIDEVMLSDALLEDGACGTQCGFALLLSWQVNEPCAGEPTVFSAPFAAARSRSWPSTRAIPGSSST